jgi:hypothetical protein
VPPTQPKSLDLEIRVARLEAAVRELGALVDAVAVQERALHAKIDHLMARVDLF